MKHIKNFTLVDDDDIYVYLTKKTIEQTELVDLINVFENGLDALNFIKENKENPDVLPEIMLLDLSMPIMDGWQFLEEYAKLNSALCKKITIYICSSTISPDDINRANAISEVTDYMIKPVTKDKLIQVIKTM